MTRSAVTAKSINIEMKPLVVKKAALSLLRSLAFTSVEEIQDRYFNLRNVALDSLMDLIRDTKTARADGTNPAFIQQAQEYQRKGQFMIDYVMSENSMGFHAPEESVRILGDAINLCRLGQLALKGGPQPTHTILTQLATPPPAGH